MSEFTPDDSTDEALPQSGRLQILSPVEYELLWGFPRFTQSDRDLFFTLTVPERKSLEQRRLVRTRNHLLPNTYLNWYAENERSDGDNVSDRFEPCCQCSGIP